MVGVKKVKKLPPTGAALLRLYVTLGRTSKDTFLAFLPCLLHPLVSALVLFFFFFFLQWLLYDVVTNSQIRESFVSVDTLGGNLLFCVWDSAI